MNQPEFKGGIIVNIQSARAFLRDLMSRDDVAAEDLYPYIDQYVGTQVKTLAFNIFCQSSTTPSKVFSDYEDLYNRKVENGIRVDYKQMYADLHKWYNEFNIDPYEIFFKRCRAKKIEPWISVRMNDCNGARESTFNLRSDFFYEARENGWMVGILPGHGLHYHYCYDYAVPEVRQKMFEYIKEQLGRYNVDAIELDFTREIICFRYTECPDRCQIMTEFIRKIKWLTDMVSIKYCHKVKLAVRLYRDIDQCKEFGFDVEQWAREGLVDHVTLGSRFMTSDSDIPIAEWKRRFPNISVAASMETYYRPPYNKTDISYRIGKHMAMITSDIGNGMAAAYVSQGVDSMYLYGYGMNPYADKLSLGNKLAYELITTVGGSDTIFSSRRRHMIMFQEQETVPAGFEAYHPIPMSVSRGESAEISLPVGYVPEGKKAQLLLGFNYGEPSDLIISVNGRKYDKFIKCDDELLTYFESYERGVAIVAPGNILYVCDIEAEPLMRYTIEFFGRDDVVIEHIEVDIN